MTFIVMIAAVAIVMISGRATPRHRAITALAPVSEPGRSTGQTARSPARIAAAAVALLGAITLIGGGRGATVGAAMAGLIAIVPARRRPEVVPPGDVAIVVDLVAGCLDAGAALPQALDAAGMTSTGLLRERCVAVASALRAGATGAEAWQSWLNDPSLAAFARTAIRTSRSGAAAAEDFRRTSTRLRACRRARAQQRVRQASVWLVVPLGLCFLPAFVLVAVVPIVVGLFPALRL